MASAANEAASNVVRLRPEPRSAFLAARDAAARIKIARRWAARLRALRDARDTIMPYDLFGEPSWELLIELFVTESEGSPPMLAALCRSISARKRVARAHIDGLRNAGLVEIGCCGEQSEATVMLTPVAVNKLTDLFCLLAVDG